MLALITGKKNSILRSENKEIKIITPNIKKLALDMFIKMHECKGIGLAAPQIGKNIQLFIVDGIAFEDESQRGNSKFKFEKIDKPDIKNGYVFINPVINKISKPYDNEAEGCLSIPKQQGLVKRARRVNIRAKNLKGEEFKLQAKGFLARVLQHEYDHLQGILICDKWHIIKHKI